MRPHAEAGTAAYLFPQGFWPLRASSNSAQASTVLLRISSTMNTDMPHLPVNNQDPQSAYTKQLIMTNFQSTNLRIFEHEALNSGKAREY